MTAVGRSTLFHSGRTGLTGRLKGPQERDVKFKLSTASETHEAAIRSAIGKPQVLCVTRGQRQNNPSQLEYEAWRLM